MTAEDKTWTWIGAGLFIVGGGIYAYNNFYKKKEVPYISASTETDTDTYTEPKPKPSYVIPKPKPKPSPKPNPKPAGATFIYAKGQKIMCNVVAGMTAYDVQQKADLTFWSKKMPIKEFGNGDFIGEIVSIQKTGTNTIFYIVKGDMMFSSESFANNYYYVEHSQIKGIAPILPTTSLENLPTLNRSLLLKKGIKGNEVRQLQKLLKIDVDGDFGDKTEQALLAKKKVKSISLSNF